MVKEGVDRRRLSYQRSVDMRYVGQEYSINIPVLASAGLDSVVEDFHLAHQRRYGHSDASAEAELVNLRVAAIGSLPHRGESHPTKQGSSNAVQLGERRVVFSGAVHATPVFARDALVPSFRFEGPAIVEEKSATTVVPPGWRAAVDGHGHLLLTKREEP